MDNVLIGIFGIGIALFSPFIIVYKCLKWILVKGCNIILRKKKQATLIEYDFDIDFYLFILASLICSPFFAICYAGYLIYCCMPWEISKRVKCNREIRELEEKLGLTGRNCKTLYYDPYYYKNQVNDREDYLNDLKQKLIVGYKSPDIIIAAEKIQSSFKWRPKHYHALLLFRKEYYNIPKDDLEPVQKRRHRFLLCEREDLYNNPELFFKQMFTCKRYGMMR